jgi:DNA-binding transcriptional ArsR family regulator
MSVLSDRCKEKALTDKELPVLLAALGHPQRLRVIDALAGGRVHVSELARRLGLSRPLLYLHLERLEQAGLVTGKLELAEGGRAMKYYELADFDVHITVDTVRAAVHAASEQSTPTEGTSS